MFSRSPTDLMIHTVHTVGWPSICRNVLKTHRVSLVDATFLLVLCNSDKTPPISTPDTRTRLSACSLHEIIMSAFGFGMAGGKPTLTSVWVKRTTALPDDSSKGCVSGVLSVDALLISLSLSRPLVHLDTTSRTRWLCCHLLHQKGVI